MFGHGVHVLYKPKVSIIEPPHLLTLLNPRPQIIRGQVMVILSNRVISCLKAQHGLGDSSRRIAKAMECVALRLLFRLCFATLVAHLL